jgi:hypothetical protein
MSRLFVDKYEYHQVQGGVIETVRDQNAEISALRAENGQDIHTLWEIVNELKSQVESQIFSRTAEGGTVEAAIGEGVGGLTSTGRGGISVQDSGPDGSMSRGMPRANPEATAAARPACGDATQQTAAVPMTLVGHSFCYSPKVEFIEKKVRCCQKEIFFVRVGRSHHRSTKVRTPPIHPSQLRPGQLEGGTDPLGGISPPRVFLLHTAVDRLIDNINVTAVPRQSRASAAPPRSSAIIDRNPRPPLTSWNPAPVSRWTREVVVTGVHLLQCGRGNIIIPSVKTQPEGSVSMEGRENQSSMLQQRC